MLQYFKIKNRNMYFKIKYNKGDNAKQHRVTRRRNGESVGEG